MPSNLYATGQSLFDVQPDRNCAGNRTIYFTYAVLPAGANPAAQRSPAHVHVASATISADDTRLDGVRDLLDAEGTGGRVIQGADGTLLVTSTVPAGLGVKSEDWMQPQQLDSLMGKVLRINTDGSIPKDNPFVGRSGVVQSIWSYGHRNPQGLAWDPVTGKLWESEHGPQGGDEINIIEPGKNYGWGVITMGVQPGITKRSQDGMEQPIVYWTPSVAPSGIAFYTGDKYPGWKNNLFVSCLGGQQLKRLEISGDKVTHEEIVFNQFGRLHDVIVGPDGYLYTTLQLPGRQLSESTEGMVVRLIPQ
jgi:glucose/arabinose dehydrogenase